MELTLRWKYPFAHAPQKLELYHHILWRKKWKIRWKGPFLNFYMVTNHLILYNSNNKYQNYIFFNFIDSHDYNPVYYNYLYMYLKLRTWLFKLLKYKKISFILCPFWYIFFNLLCKLQNTNSIYLKNYLFFDLDKKVLIFLLYLKIFLYPHNF